MKKITKVVSIVLALLMMIMSVVSCGSSNNEPETGANGLTKLKLGGIGPLTGDYANYGTSVKQGAELAVKEINAAGGINGFEFDLAFEDSKGDPDSAVAAYGSLIDNGMKVSLGAVFSGEMASVTAAAAQDGILLLSPSASAKDSISGNDAAFRVCFNDPQQGSASAVFIDENQLAKKVAVFYQSDIDYSKGLYETFQAECKVRGIEITTVETFTASTNTDFSSQISKIKNSGAGMVFIPIYAAEASTFLTQAYGKLNDMIFFGCDGLDGILTKVSDVKYAENVMMLTPFSADDTDAKVQHFVKEYKAAYNVVPDQFAADGYDAIYAIAEAIKSANATPENFMDDSFNANMVAAMTKIEVVGVTGTMTWTADGETNKAAKAMIIHDGVAALYKAK